MIVSEHQQTNKIIQRDGKYYYLMMIMFVFYLTLKYPFEMENTVIN
jgi:hypothetical protein